MSSTEDREGQTSHSGLSIVLPTFNEGGSIRQVIESLLRLETDHPLEILVVDDDSRDGTLIWCAPWPAKTPGSGSFSGWDARTRQRHQGRPDRSPLSHRHSDGQRWPARTVLRGGGRAAPESRGADLAGSRFLDQFEIRGLSDRRTDGSSLANRLAR